MFRERQDYLHHPKYEASKMAYRDIKNSVCRLRISPYNQGSIHPFDNASTTMKWDAAESAMKTLMCAEDIKARITHHHHGGYSVTVVSNERELANDVFIAPLQKKEMMQRWTGKYV